MGLSSGITSLSRSNGQAGPAAHRKNLLGHPGSHLALDSALMMTADVAAVLLALYFALDLGLGKFPQGGAALRHAISSTIAPLVLYVGYLLWFIFAMVVVNRHLGIYRPHPHQSLLHEQRKTAQACLTAGLLLCGAMYMTNASVPRAVVAYLMGLTALFVGTLRGLRRYSVQRMYEKGMETSHVLILGTTPIGEAIRKQVTSCRQLGRTFMGFVSIAGPNDSSTSSEDKVLGNMDQLRTLVRQHFIDEVIVADSCGMATVVRLIDLARELDFEVVVVPGFYDGLGPEAHIEYLGDFPIAALHRRKSKLIARFLKQCCDFVFSLSALVALSPTFLLIAIAIRLDSPGPIFYVSERIGKKGRVFRMFKFRTMVCQAEQLRSSLLGGNERDGILFKLKNDPRITRLGRLLRKYSLDELPQLANVLRGDMSVVGPRPPITSEVERYELEHYRRLEVAPGLTGLWQVRARQDPSFERYVALDLEYIENWSLWLDFKILVRTAEVVLRGTGC